VHYVGSTDAVSHDAMLCIQTGAKIEDEKRMRFDSQQFYLKSRAEMEQLFAEVPESVVNTQAVAEMCELSIPFPKGSERYPKYPLPAEVTGGRESYLRQLCLKGMMSRYGVGYGEESPLSKTLSERIDYELSIIGKTGFVDYFLVVWDFIDWARQQGIPVGPGRGSGAGCIAAYLLGITNLDPLRFKLLFERFLNPERVSPPDFDIDFCMRRRGEVIDYVRRKYGDQCVANIVTYGTMGAKMVIRDVARVHNVAFADADRLAKMIPDELNITLESAIEKSAELRLEIERNPVAKKIMDQARVLEGMVRNTGKHAAGIIITDQPLSDFVPLTLQEGDVTVQFDMNAVGKLGLLKMDFLGLKTLTVIADAVDNIRRTADPAFDIEKIPIDDPRTFALLNTGRTTGVFQLESGGMQNLCRSLQVSSIDEIIALIALYRPGPMDWIPDYIKGKKDPSTVTYPHPLLEEVCRETYGIMVYQEQVMEAAKVIAGYTLGGADMLRRAMGKKDAEAMAKERAKFVSGAAQLHGIDEKTSNAIFDILNKFAGYGFNKSHSAAYAVLSYQTGFLKANYPVQFMAAMLSSELGNAEKVSHFIAECEAMGMKVLGPDVNESRENFTPVVRVATSKTAEIRFGLAGVKGVGELAAKRIIEEREKNGPYASFDDLVTRVDGRAMNKRVLEHLVKTGAFDFAGHARKQLFEGIDSAMSAVAAHARDRAAGQHSFLEMLGNDSDRSNAPSFAQATAGRARADDFTTSERLTFEKELLGFYISGHPLDVFRELTEALDTFPADQVALQAGRTEFRLCGIASGIAKKLSKKDNRPWAAFTLATRGASLPLNMFADAYANYSPMLTENAAVLVLGNVIVGNDGARINVKELYPLAGSITSLIKKVTWLLHPSHAQTAEFLQLLRTTMNGQPGETRVEFGFLFADRVTPVAEATSALSWKLMAPVFQELRAHPAVAGVQFETKRLELKADRRWSKK